jgi:uncharacterized protein YjiS (DUF1127 family)
MNILAKLHQARRRRQAVRQLRAMEAYVLRDIGIEPGQIEEAVSGMLTAESETEAKRPAPTLVRKPAPDALAFKAGGFAKADWPYPRRRAA